jgi:DNA-binding response OmpR family regulator
MSRRVLVIEPDGAIRQMLEYALSSGGFAPVGTPTVESARALLDGKPIEAVVVEMRATNADGTDGVRALRADYPELPLVVTGTLLTPRVMQELIRVRVDDVVPKPFTPREIVSAVERVLGGARTRHNGGLEYAAAIAIARRAIAEGRVKDAESPLARARAVSPLDGEAMALYGLLCELEGHDREADRAYRAALALQEERVTEDISPLDGLRRLRAYGGARAVPAFEHHGRHTLWFVSEPESGRDRIHARARTERNRRHIRPARREQTSLFDCDQRRERAARAAHREHVRTANRARACENARAHWLDESSSASSAEPHRDSRMSR